MMVLVLSSLLGWWFLIFAIWDFLIVVVFYLQLVKPRHETVATC